MEEDVRYWEIWFRTFEEDERWTTARCPVNWEESDVRERFNDMIINDGGVGGDPCDFISAEWTFPDDDYGYDYT